MEDFFVCDRGRGDALISEELRSQRDTVFQTLPEVT